MRRVEILWLTENYFPDKGGMAQSCDRIVHNLRQAGVVVHIIHFSNKRANPNLHLVQQGSCKVFALSHSIEHTLYMANLFIERESTYKNVTHIVAFGGNYTLFYAPMLAQFLQKPLVICFRGNDFDAGIFSPKKRQQVFYALQKAAAVACVSSDKCKMIQALFPEVSVYHTPNGLDKKNWMLLPSDIKKGQDIKNKIDPNKRIIGIIGHLKIKKGLSFFLQALNQGQFQAQVHLILVGHIEEPSIFETLEQMQLSYTNAPFVDRFDLLPYYYASDIIAIPSFYDGMPNVLLEAALLQKTFIASDVAGMRDVLRAEEDAFIFKVNDLDAAQGAINKFLQYPLSQIKTMGLKAYENVLAHYTEAQEIQNYLSIFQKH